MVNEVIHRSQFSCLVYKNFTRKVLMVALSPIDYLEFSAIVLMDQDIHSLTFPQHKGAGRLQPTIKSYRNIH